MVVLSSEAGSAWIRPLLTWTHPLSPMNRLPCPWPGSPLEQKLRTVPSAAVILVRQVL